MASPAVVVQGHLVGGPHAAQSSVPSLLQVDARSALVFGWGSLLSSSHYLGASREQRVLCGSASHSGPSWSPPLVTYPLFKVCPLGGVLPRLRREILAVATHGGTLERVLWSFKGWSLSHPIQQAHRPGDSAPDRRSWHASPCRFRHTLVSGAQWKLIIIKEAAFQLSRK